MINYFLRMLELYSTKVCELSSTENKNELLEGLSYLNTKEKEFLAFLIKNRLYEFTPVDVGKAVGVTNKTVINRCAKLVSNGFLVPIIVKERIRSYKLSEFTIENQTVILEKMCRNFL